MAVKVSTCLWFDHDAEAAAEFYVSLLPDSQIDRVMRPDGQDQALVVEVTLAGTPYQFLNGGPVFKLDEAASIAVTTPDQAETDRLWTALTADGGAESRCGWLRDRFGLSWQIVPQACTDLMMGPDPAASARAMNALMGMRRIIVTELEDAYHDVAGAV